MTGGMGQAALLVSDWGSATTRRGIFHVGRRKVAGSAAVGAGYRAVLRVDERATAESMGDNGFMFGVEAVALSYW